MLDSLKELFDQIKTSNPEPAGAVEYIVAGLGNPGAQYAETRHNAGFLCVDYIADKCGCQVTRMKFRAMCGDAAIAGTRVLLLKPMTYMNLSGEAVVEAMQFYKVPIERVIVLYDDISLPVGHLRIRRKGSDAGQKGMNSIITLTGSQDFPRIKLGIGAKPHPEMSLPDWVLSRFTPDEKKQLITAFEKAYPALQLMVKGEIGEAMGRYNVRGVGEGPKPQAEEGDT